MAHIHTASFGSIQGSHQLIETSLTRDSNVISELRFLVDRPAGHLVSDISWSPYWGCGPVVDYWAIWLGEEDATAARKNMVKVDVVLIPIHEVAFEDDLGVYLKMLGYQENESHSISQYLVEAVIQSLAINEHPTVLCGLQLSPLILNALWPKLWPSLRQSISLRTLFGAESLNKSTPNRIVVIPQEVLPRWRSHNVLDNQKLPDSIFSQWFEGKVSSQFQDLIEANYLNLPNNLSVLTRLERIATNLNILAANTGALAEVLLIIRTLESFDPPLKLPESQKILLSTTLSDFRDATIENVRTASLTKLVLFDDKSQFEDLIAQWVNKHLPASDAKDSAWIIENHNSANHAKWWCKAVSKGLDQGFTDLNPDWSNLFWKLGSEHIAIFDVLKKLIPDTADIEKKLSDAVPKKLSDEFLLMVVEFCRERNWPILLAHCLGNSRSLKHCIESVIQNSTQPELALPTLLKGRSATDILTTAVELVWKPLEEKLPALTIESPALLGKIKDFDRLKTILNLHINAGGDIPQALLNKSFIIKIFDGALISDDASLKIIGKMNAEGGKLIAAYSQSMSAWPIIYPVVNESFINGTVAKWWEDFFAGHVNTQPYSRLTEKIQSEAFHKLEKHSVKKLIEFLSLFPEVKESVMQSWLNDTGFEWDEGDHQMVANFLIKKNWRSLINDIRHSWKRELVMVAWYARDLLIWNNKFWSTPKVIIESRDVPPPILQNTPINKKRKKKIKVLFLAANPQSSEKLALDEEFRAIKTKMKGRKGKFEITVDLAVRPLDLQEIILEAEPSIVHFSGHGGGESGLVFHSENLEEDELVSGQALANLFKALNSSISIVVLNACYSDVQARSIVEQVDFVIGMKDTITDEVAEVFSVAFYMGLTFGKSVKEAFDLGLSQLILKGLNTESAVPKLLTRDGVSADHTFLIDSK